MIKKGASGFKRNCEFVMNKSTIQPQKTFCFRYCIMAPVVQDITLMMSQGQLDFIWRPRTVNCVLQIGDAEFEKTLKDAQ